jgi:hypothetical protein
MSYLLPHLHRRVFPLLRAPISTRRGAPSVALADIGEPSHTGAVYCSGWAVDQAIMSEEDRLVVVRECPSLPSVIVQILCRPQGITQAKAQLG